ncbi:MAG: helix-turn-helix domain-containing protein [Oscillospiraceae bacterium]|nr:helix-turn-helix domain-containing protein [Oscillospiraceae bacterium]
MLHKAIELRLLEGTAMEITFQDGVVKRYDMSALFPKYPQLKQLGNRDLFLSGKLMGAYGIVWNDELDIETETIYEDGKTVRKEEIVIHKASSQAVAAARAAAGISQKQLAALTGIDQSDISKIERGIANPSVETLDRIANALGGQLTISIKMPTAT